MAVTSDFFETESRNWRARLDASVDLMRSLSRSSDPEEMYEIFARRMDELFPVSRRLLISRRGLHYPDYRVTRFSHWKEPANPWTESDRLPVHSGGLLAELLYADEPQLIPDLVVDPDDPAAEYLAGQRALLAIPNFDQGAAVNALILCRDEVDSFPLDRMPDLVMLSNLFARTTQSLVLSRKVREAYDAVDFEMRSVADIQRALLPTTLPDVAGLDVAVDYQTARRAGGDYYDFFALPGGRLGVLIADASGHGAPAAVLMAMTHAITHSGSEPPLRPAALLATLNRHLARRYTRPTGSFVTAFYAVFDPANETLTYASAGHNPPRLRRADRSRAVLNRAQRLPLGIKPDETYTEHSLALRSGDDVILFTDGVIEAVDGDGEVFGTGRIDEALVHDHLTAGELLRTLLDRWTAFTSSQSPADDRTLIVVRRT